MEAAADENAMLCDRGTFLAIVRALRDYGATGLHCSDRYALQLTVTGTDIATAFAGALLRWDEVARPLTPAGWSLVRAELCTRKEFESELTLGE
jgi:hypothetical protein